MLTTAQGMAICNVSAPASTGSRSSAQTIARPAARPVTRRIAATLAPSRRPLAGISASAWPRLSSISGTVTAPSMRVVSISQAGTGTFSSRIATASTEASRMGLFQLPRVLTPGSSRTAMVCMTKELTAKNATATDRPASPKASCEIGRPRLPALGRKAVGSSVRTGSRPSLSSKAHASAHSSSASSVAAATSASARSSRRVVTKVWNTSAGVVTEVTRVVMKAPPNGRSRLPQKMPMPTHDNRGNISTMADK